MTVEYSYEAYALPLNQWRTKHYMAVAKIRAEWREAFGWLFKANPHVFTGPVDIVVVHEVKRKQDPASCVECYKAALDGLVDGGMIPDDTGDWVRSVTFMAPIKNGVERLTLRVSEATNPSEV